MQAMYEDREKMDYCFERFERFAFASEWKVETWAIRLNHDLDS